MAAAVAAAALEMVEGGITHRRALGVLGVDVDPVLHHEIHHHVGLALGGCDVEGVNRRAAAAAGERGVEDVVAILLEHEL